MQKSGRNDSTSQLESTSLMPLPPGKDSDLVCARHFEAQHLFVVHEACRAKSVRKNDIAVPQPIPAHVRIQSVPRAFPFDIVTRITTDTADTDKLLITPLAERMSHNSLAIALTNQGAWFSAASFVTQSAGLWELGKALIAPGKTLIQDSSRSSRFGLRESDKRDVSYRRGRRGSALLRLPGGGAA